MSDKRRVKQVSFFTANVITTLSITLVLFLLALTLLVGLAGRGFTDYLKENMGISLEFSSDINESEVSNIEKRLRLNPYIKDVAYISKEEVKKQLIEDLGRDPEEVLGYNPARSYFDVYIKSDYLNPDSIKLVERSLKAEAIGDQPIFTDMVYNQHDITNISTNLSIITTVLLILAVILIFISFTLIRSIIQLNIYSKRFLINTMKLVGATNSFIRRPFLTRMIVCGIIGAVLANLAITGLAYYMSLVIPAIKTIVTQTEMIAVYASVIIFGILITAIATTTAVNKYLRMIANNLYHI